jgi:WD40 repeat protein
LLDWSHSNILAVCLAQTVYLWNAYSGEIQQLYDTENDNEIVTSVSWMNKSSNVLAIGNSRKEVVLMDAEKFQPINCFKDQH